MSDDLDDDDLTPSVAARAPSAAAFAALSSASRDKADAYLEKQTILADLQIDNLAKLDAFELSHLRWRRFNDRMKGALQIMGVIIGAVILVALGAALYNASQADGLVIDAFTVPPSLAAQGLGGDVLARDITNRVDEVRNFTNANSLSNSSDVSQNNENSAKVEIPSTGVSLAEAWRYLRAWLGHERHVSGSVRELPGGLISIDAAFGGGDIIAVTGRASDLDALERKAGEQIFEHFDPLNFTVYLWSKGRNAEAIARAEANVHLNLPRKQMADAYSLWANVTRDLVGNLPLSIARARIAVTLDPFLAAAWNELAAGEFYLGHDEAALANARMALAQTEADQPKPLQGAGFLSVRGFAAARAALGLGDFDEAERASCGGDCLPTNLQVAAYYAARRHDVASARALLAKAGATAEDDAGRVVDTRYYIAADQDDWRNAVDWADKRAKAFEHEWSGESEGLLGANDATRTRPMRAIALAELGDFEHAERVAQSTPEDCIACLRARARIDTLRHDWTSAARWYQKAAQLAPTIPFVELEWGQMLLARGDIAGALAKFASAHAKGPHFADPLEAWGEVLMLQNHSDLALAKFSEANRYAPHWGRLHLKWGEALGYVGRKDEARVQFVLARAPGDEQRVPPPLAGGGGAR